MTDWLKIYSLLPWQLRTVAAGMRGYYLKSWRYGRDTEKLMEEAVERERWTPEQWKTWQETRLNYVLNRAATQVPYYRDMWLMMRRSNRVSWDYLENWPILEKEKLRQAARSFVADDCDTRRMFHEHTSGTTGKSIDLWWSRDTVRAWYALWETRCRLWHGVSRHDRWAILGGQLVTPVRQRKPPFWVWNDPLHQLYMSSYHLSPVLLPSYLDALLQYRIRYLWGYTSSLYALALEVIRLKRKDLRMAVVLTNAEPVDSFQREVIAEAFQCPVRETYGMAEIVATASECSDGCMHLWPEVGLVEVVEGDRFFQRNGTGEFICTGLFNADMPLIRYRIGDRGALPKTEDLCRCGRGLPGLHSIEGRTDDVLYTQDGRRIGRLDPVFKSHLPVREAQIIQESLKQIRVRFIPDLDYTVESGNSIIERIQSRMGDIQVVLEAVDELPREKNGKFRAVICKLSPEERDSIQK